MQRPATTTLVSKLLASSVLLFACGSNDPTTGTGGGGNSVGGSSGVGGTTLTHGGSSGGTSMTGGSSSSTGSSSGGANATGGSSSPSGGTQAAGGKAGGGTAPAGGKASGGSSSQGGSSAGGSTHTGVWKVMPLGDSITGTTCYPQLTSRTLKDGGHTNFQFVGSIQNNQSCNAAPFVQTEGHGGYLVTYLTTNTPAASGKGTLTELKSWATAKPDIVLMHFGTNDAWSSIAPAQILSAYVTVLTEFRAQNPSVVFFVSKIIPLAPAGCSNCRTNVVNLNAAITLDWATANSTSTSPVYLIDHWTGFDAATDTADGAHPNLAGSQKMATVTANALTAKGYF